MKRTPPNWSFLIGETSHQIQFGAVMVKIREKSRNAVADASYKITKFIGTPKSIVLHTALFIGIFGLRFFGVHTADILLILTTAVSLEAIYLSIFIQMSVNKTVQALEDVEDDIEDIQEDVEDISEDIEEIHTKVKKEKTKKRLF